MSLSVFRIEHVRKMCAFLLFCGIFLCPTPCFCADNNPASVSSLLNRASTGAFKKNAVVEKSEHRGKRGPRGKRGHSGKQEFETLKGSVEVTFSLRPEQALTPGHDYGYVGIVSPSGKQTFKKVSGLHTEYPVTEVSVLLESPIEVGTYTIFFKSYCNRPQYEEVFHVWSSWHLKFYEGDTVYDDFTYYPRLVQPTEGNGYQIAFSWTPLAHK